MRLRHVAALFAALPLAAQAVPPEACSLLVPEEINRISDRPVEKMLPVKSGNPSQCNFVDSKKGAMVVVTVREVQYAVQQEMQQERDNLEKIYRSSTKNVDTVGDAGFWMPSTRQLYFRKGKTITSVSIAGNKSATELDTAILARLVESRIPK